mgnify:CR=1 FL=1
MGLVLSAVYTSLVPQGLCPTPIPSFSQGNSEMASKVTGPARASKRQGSFSVWSL